MSRFGRVLLIVVLAELAIAGYVVYQRSAAVRPPAVNLERLDRRTAAEFRETQTRVAAGEPAAWEELAVAYLAFGYFAESDACFGQAALLVPPTPEFYVSWGICLDRLGRLDAAIEKFERAKELQEPERREVSWYHMARCYLRQEKLEQARAALEAAGDFELARFQLAKLDARTGQPEQAAAILDGMLSMNPTELKLNQLRAKVASDLGDVATARRCRSMVERATDRLFLDSTVEYVGLLRVMRGLPRFRAQTAEVERSGQLAAAADELDEALKLEWDLATARRLVRLDVRINRIDAASEVLKQMTERFGASPEFLEQQGDMAFLQGRADEAEELWQRAIELRPNARLHQMLAGAAERRGDAAAAARHRARQEYQLGLQFYRGNKELEAYQRFEKAVELDPQQPEAWFFMGELQRASGHAEDAARLYRKCLVLRPHSGKALDALAEVEEPAATAN